MPTQLLYSIITIIFSFIIVNFYSFLQQKRKLKTSLNHGRNYARFWLATIRKGLQKQRPNIEKYITTVETWDVQKRNYYDKVSVPYEKLTSMVPTELFSIFVTNSRGDSDEKQLNYRTLTHSIDFLHIKEANILKHIEGFQVRTDKRMVSLHQLYTDIEKLRIETIQSRYKTNDKDEFACELTSLNIGIKISTIEQLFKVYIQPLDVLCNKVFEKFQDDETMPIFFNLLFKYKGLYEYFLEDKIEHSARLKEYLKVIDEYAMKLEALEETYLKLKFRLLFNLK